MARTKSSQSKRPIETYQPTVDRKVTRVTGPFTVEAVPAPAVKSVDSVLWSVGSGQRTDHWPLTTDHSIARSGETLRQVFFPLAAEDEGWAKLARNLKAEIDPDRIEAFRGTVSLPFEAGEHRRIAVKIVDDRGIESLKVVRLEG